MKTRLLLLILVLCLAATAIAQIAPGPDRLGIYADMGATQNLVIHEPGTPFEIYLILTNPSGPEGVVGWECSMDIPDNAAIWGFNVPGVGAMGSIAPEEMYMVYSSPDNLPGAAGPIVHLMTLIVWLLDEEPAQFGIGAALHDSGDFGLPVFLDASDLLTILPLTPYPDGEGSIAFCFNPDATASQTTTWGNVRAMYR